MIRPSFISPLDHRLLIDLLIEPPSGFQGKHHRHFLAGRHHTREISEHIGRSRHRRPIRSRYSRSLHSTFHLRFSFSIAVEIDDGHTTYILVLRVKSMSQFVLLLHELCVLQSRYFRTLCQNLHRNRVSDFLLAISSIAVSEQLF